MAFFSKGMQRTLFFLFAGLAFAGASARAQTVCDRAGCGPIRQGTQVVCFTPAHPAPQILWGNLQPTDPDPLPPDRDTTNFNEVTQAYYSRNWFFGVDVQNGYVIGGLAHGVGVWDARTSPGNPTLMGVKLYAPVPGFPYIPGGESSKIVFGAVAAPPGVDTLAAEVGYSGAGFILYDLRNKTSPTAIYQDPGKTSESVYIANIGGRTLGFMPSNVPSGVFIYDLDIAKNFTGCFEPRSGNIPSCAQTAIVAQINTPGTPYFVHGVGNYLAVGMGSSSGLQIYDVSTPSNPQLKLTALTNSGPGGRPVGGVAMWQQGTSLYLGARLGQSLTNAQKQTAIYDVSCLATPGGCSSLNQIWIGNFDGQGSSDYLTFSRSSSKPFLFLGTNGYCQGADGSQREWLLDVSNPAAAYDVTPTQTTNVTAPYNGTNVTVPVNYWSWYYRGSPTGFNLVSPHSGKFMGDYFYRAGRSLMDVHRLTTASPPASDFSWSPAQIYPGTPVTFTDLSTGSPTGWSWSFQPDGSPSLAAVKNPVVSFGASGPKTVSLVATNTVGTGTNQVKTVQVLNPAAQVASVTFQPASPVQCQQVNLTANGVAGQPALAYGWVGTDAGSNPISGLVSGGTTATWSIPGNFTASPATITFTVSNALPSSASASATITVATLPTLTAPIPAPTFSPNPPPAGTVTFSLAAVPGATHWHWDFGSGSTPATYDTSDTTLGPNPPMVTYSTIGVKTVTVTVSNCVNTTGLSSSTTVNIVQTTPLVASFQALCAFAPCAFTAGSPITLVDSSTGASFWDYDWNHTGSSSSTCSYTDAGHTAPVTSHIYTTAGMYQPCLQVRRGTSEQNVYVHPSFSVSPSAPPPTPTITLSGPSSGQTGAALGFSASASNCAPSSTWTWNAAGGTIGGSATSNSVSITWSSAGTKTISVTNSGCGSATGIKTVTVSSGSTGGGNLGASFTVTPASPAAGSAAVFDGTASTGNPTSYFWTFGDGATSSSGATVSHTYAQAGAYTAKLDVAAVTSQAACQSVNGFYSNLDGTCTKTTTKSIAVVTAGPPPLVAALSSGICTNQYGIDVCATQTGLDATFTSTANDGVTSWSWDFGDGNLGSGQVVTHHWNSPGSYAVLLTVSDGSRTASRGVNVTVTGAPKYAYVLPWIWKTAVTQSTSRDFYAYNPGTSTMTLTVTFLRAGGDMSALPAVQIPVQAGQTFRSNDPLGLFSPRIPDGSGFLYFTWDGGGVDPVIAGTDGVYAAGADQPSFGETVVAVKIPQISSRSSASADLPLLHLVGLAETADKITTLGFSNPYGTPAVINVRFYDADGTAVGVPVLGLTVARNGQRQFTVGKIRDQMGVTGADVRATVEAVTGGPVTAFGVVSTTTSQDPSFVAPGSSGNAKQYLVGVATDAKTATDVLLVNPGSNVALVDMTFKDVVTTAPQRDAVHLTLQPGESMRIADVLRTSWGLTQGFGTLVFESNVVDSVYPIVRGELHNNVAPASAVGMLIPPLSDDDAAAATDATAQSLLSWRREPGYEPTVWMFNPTSDFAQFDLVFLDATGQSLGTKAGLILGPGRMRQFKAAGLSLPQSVPGGFTLQVKVRAGSVFVAGQVRTLATGDTRYVGPAAH